MTSQALELLADVDRQARDMLMDSYGMDPGFGVGRGWAHAMRSAAAAWNAIPATAAWQASDIVVGDPFTTAATIATHIESDSGLVPAAARPDDRLMAIVGLLNQVGPEILRELPVKIRPDGSQQHQAAQLRTTLLHVGYVLTHATVNSVISRATHAAGGQSGLGYRIEVLATRIRGVEQTLDAHLHRTPAPGKPSTEIGSLDRAVDRFLYAAYQTQQPASAATNLVVADVGRMLTGHTARLAIRSAEHGRSPVIDFRDRMLPALQASVHQWEAARALWARMLAPTDHPLPEIATAGIQLQRVLREPKLADHPAVTTSMTRMLTAVTELAVLNQRALADPGRTAPAQVVADLTAEALAQRPNTVDPLQIWLSIERIDGPAPIVLPDIVRDRLVDQGQATLDASVRARSAGHALAGHPGYQSLLQLHEPTAGPRRPPVQAPHRSQAVSAPRIG